MSKSIHSAIAVMLAVAVTALPARSDAQTSTTQTSKAVDAHLERGLAHYKAREFEDAIAEFRAGYDTEPRPEFLFALAQAERRSGDCASALVYYRQFIDTEPPKAQVKAARMHIEGCRDALASGPVAGDERAREPASPLSAGAPPLPPPAPWYHDLVGDSLLGAGTVSLLAGAGLIAASESARDRAAWAASYSEYDLEIARARRYRIWGTVALSAGVGLAAGALYRFYRGADTEQRDLGVSVARDGVTLSYGGHF